MYHDYYYPAPQPYHPSGQPMEYEYPAQGPTQPKSHQQQQFQMSPSQQNQGQRVPVVRTFLPSRSTVN
jgi:hypothetical protein